MAVYYLKHEKHGCKVATSDLEVMQDEKNGWELSDPETDPLDHDGDGRKGGSRRTK